MRVPHNVACIMGSVEVAGVINISARTKVPVSHGRPMKVKQSGGKQCGCNERIIVLLAIRTQVIAYQTHHKKYQHTLVP
jgi:hypothetical protein